MVFAQCPNKQRHDSRLPILLVVDAGFLVSDVESEHKNNLVFLGSVLVLAVLKPLKSGF